MTATTRKTEKALSPRTPKIRKEVGAEPNVHTNLQEHARGD
jgi:hypothetical protein